MVGNTIIEISLLIQSARVQLNETCMALQSGQWALVHLNLLDKQLTELGMTNARHYEWNSTNNPLKNSNKILINTFAF
jgi:hypothetical protein